jgi:hypothetical protein
MKNIHLIPTDKPSRLFYNKKDSIFTIDNDFEYRIKEDWFQDYNIYITSDEEIKEGDWFYDSDTKYIKIKQSWENSHLDFNGKKIILTTDQDLDGVQAIDDEFLEWYINNPFCEEVEIESWQTKGEWDLDYKIIIPKDEPKDVVLGYKTSLDAQMLDKIEPKQETLEEVAKSEAFEFKVDYKPFETDLNYGEYAEFGFEKGFIAGAKRQQDKNKYSEEEVIAFAQWMYDYKGDINKVEELLEQFKKK